LPDTTIKSDIIQTRSFNEIKIGDKAYFTKTISEEDIYIYCGISGDFNPLHVNELYASKRLFKGRVAHGLLVASFISNVLGMQLPGNGTVYISQNIKFFMPVYIGDTITTTVEVIDKIDLKHHIVLRTFCINQNHEYVIDGEAKVLFNPDEHFQP
jgi:3-hydroxybutyryl-CoA dehydratase